MSVLRRDYCAALGGTQCCNGRGASSAGPTSSWSGEQAGLRTDYSEFYIQGGTRCTHSSTPPSSVPCWRQVWLSQRQRKQVGPPLTKVRRGVNSNPICSHVAPDRAAVA